MKKVLAAMGLSGALLAAAQARWEKIDFAPPPAARQPPQQLDWSGWTRPVGETGAPQAALGADRIAASSSGDDQARADDIDVVDAHWMALTMWGEARGQGETGMRAVGHVIHNRWQAKRHGAFVTETVSEAFQFSCWNRNDPNRAAMLNIEDLEPGSAEHRLWLAAKRLATEILSGQSIDPTGGALFYHSIDVQPAWSHGIAPVNQIGSHLFFVAAR